MTPREIHNIEKWRKLAHHSGYRLEAFYKEFKVCHRQVQRYTQETFGQSPRRWLAQQRLIIAPSLLLEHRSVKKVALELGFKQVSHFSREFKRFHECSPTEFLADADAEPADE